MALLLFFFFFQAEDGIRDRNVTGVQTCALPICEHVTRERKRPRPASPAQGPVLAHAALAAERVLARSEERRVGKECRSRRAPYHQKKKVAKTAHHRTATGREITPVYQHHTMTSQ